MTQPPKTIRKRITGRIYRSYMSSYSFLEPMLPTLPIPKGRLGNVVMCHSGRVGSAVLASMLAATPGIFWDDEVFTPDRGLWRRETTPDRLLRRRMGCALFRFYGFELKLHHVQLFGPDWPTVLDRLTDFGFTHFVVLNRRNILRSIVSRTIDRSGGLGRIRAGADQVFQPIALDPDRIWLAEGPCPLLPALAKVSEQIDTLERALEGRPFLSLTYENDIAADPRVGYRRVCGYLGISAAEVRPTFRRVNPHPLRDLITNFDTVSATLSGTPYAWMVEE